MSMKLYRKPNTIECSDDEFVLELSRRELEWDVAMPWVKELIEDRFYFNFLEGYYDDEYIWLNYRVSEIAEVLGQERMENVVSDVEREFEVDEDRTWEIFKRGSEEERKAVQEEQSTHWRTCRCPLP